ncbi:MAG: DUF2474 family protein [Sphingobium sp.]
MAGRARRIGWFVAIWAMSVAALGVVSLAIKVVISR